MSLPSRLELERHLKSCQRLLYEIQASQKLMGDPLLGKVARTTALVDDVLERTPDHGHCSRCGEHCDYC